MGNICGLNIDQLECIVRVSDSCAREKELEREGEGERKREREEKRSGQVQGGEDTEGTWEWIEAATYQVNVTTSRVRDYQSVDQLGLATQ